MKRKITYKDLVLMNSYCRPEEIGIKSNYSATIPKFIREYRDKIKNIEDIISLLCRKDYMTERDIRLFAVWCAREALKLVDNPDPRSINVCNVAEKYAKGKATKEELDTAADAVDAAFWAAKYAGNTIKAGFYRAAWYAGDTTRTARDAAWVTSKTAAETEDVRIAKNAQIDKLLTYFE